MALKTLNLKAVDILWGRINAQFGYAEIEHAASIEETTDKALMKLLDTAIANDTWVLDIAKEVEERYDKWAGSRAEAIAVTESTGAFGAGSLNTVIEDALAGFKEWCTMGDERVREWHEEAEGLIAPVDVPFIVMGEELDEPGDPAGSSDNIDNCRCWCDYTDEGPANAPKE